jgi:hypothetical protein
MAKPKAPKTYFKQVPLKIVMKVAAMESPDAELLGAGATVKPPAKKRLHPLASGH